MQRENTAEKSGMSFVGFSESKLYMVLVSFLAELLVKTVAEIQLKICRFSLEPKASLEVQGFGPLMISAW